jgi:hypothetical protein
VTWTRIGRSWTQAAVPVGGSSVALEIVRGWLVTDHFADTGGVNVLVAAPGNDQQPPCRPWASATSDLPEAGREREANDDQQQGGTDPRPAQGHQGVPDVGADLSDGIVLEPRHPRVSRIGGRPRPA